MKKFIYQNLEKIKNYNIYLNQNFIIFKLINQIWFKILSDFDFIEEIIYNYIGNIKKKSYLKYFYYIFLIISGFIIYIFYVYLFLLICLIFYSYIIFFFKFFFKEILLRKYPNNKLYLDILNIIKKFDNIIYYFWINYPEYIHNIKAILYYIFTGKILLDFIRLKILDPIDYFLYKCLMKIEYIIKKIINIINNIDNYIEYNQYLWNKFKFKINQIKNIILNIINKFNNNYEIYLPTKKQD